MSLLSYYKVQSVTVKRMWAYTATSLYQENALSAGEILSVYCKFFWKYKYPNKAECMPRLCLCFTCYKMAQVLMSVNTPALVQEGIHSPERRMVMSGIRLNILCYSRWQACLAMVNTHLVVARATIDGTIIPGQEWDLRLRTALCTNNTVHLAWSTLAMACTTWGCTTSCAARWTTTRLIHQTFLLVELLFTCCEYEIGSALTTL